MLVGDIVTLTGAGACMVTAAEADFAVSAAEVAVTEKLLPAVDPAVNRPLVEIVPPVAVHVTAVLELPVTVAVNCWVCPVWRVMLVGDTVTLTGAGACMVTAATADLVLSAAEVAVTEKLLPAVDPAVNTPLVEIVPPVAVHVTAVLELPVTVAVNCWVCPVCNLVLAGDTETCTG